MSTELEKAKSLKIGLIEDAYEAGIERTVNAHGHDWKGGESSAGAVHGATSLAAAMGLDEVELWPTEDPSGFMFSIAEAQQVVVAIGMQFQSDFKRRKETEKQVIEAESIDDVDAVQIPGEWLVGS